MPLIYIVRHGQTDWNAELRFQGQQDIPINNLGCEQARRNGARLNQLEPQPASFDFVASPLMRARQTMELIRREMALDPDDYRQDDRLVEIHYGDWEGMTLDEMQQMHGKLSESRNRDKWNFVPPGDRAESYAMQARRFRSWLDETVEPTVCVTHGGILRCAWHVVGGLTETEAGVLTIPQDRILRLDAEGLVWL